MRKTAKDLLSMGVLNGDEIRAWIYEATRDELEDFLRVASVGDYQIPQVFFEDARAALQLRLARAALKPHWSVTPNFWLTFIAAVASAAATLFGWLEWRQRETQEQPPSMKDYHNKNRPLSSASTNLPPSPPPTTK